MVHLFLSMPASLSGSRLPRPFPTRRSYHHVWAARTFIGRKLWTLAATHQREEITPAGVQTVSGAYTRGMNGQGELRAAANYCRCCTRGAVSGGPPANDSRAAGSRLRGVRQATKEQPTGRASLRCRCRHPESLMHRVCAAEGRVWEGGTCTRRRRRARRRRGGVL